MRLRTLNTDGVEEKKKFKKEKTKTREKETEINKKKSNEQKNGKMKQNGRLLDFMRAEGKDNVRGITEGGQRSI